MEDQRLLKRQKLTDGVTEDVISLNGHVEPSSEEAEADCRTALLQIREDLARLDEQSLAEQQAVIKRYHALREDVLQRRGTILERLDSFWPDIILSSQLGEYLTEGDREVVRYVSGVNMHEDLDTAAVTITLSFEDNPFFSNPFITHVSTATGANEVVIDCTAVDWKEGQDLTQVLDTAEGVPRIQLHPFFSWFISRGTFDSEEVGDESYTRLVKDFWTDPLQYTEVGAEEEEDAGQESEQPGTDNAGEQLAVDAGAAAAPLHAPSEDDEDEDDDEEDGGDEDGYEMDLLPADDDDALAGEEEEEDAL